jgi:hypothetical protein
VLHGATRRLILAGGFAEELLDAIPAAEAMRALKDCGESAQVYVSVQ